jgi:hypothetical protein
MPLSPNGIDWTACELIEQIPGKVSGRPIVRRTRIIAIVALSSVEWDILAAGALGPRFKMGQLCKAGFSSSAPRIVKYRLTIRKYCFTVCHDD